jgi:hypothetical protein
VIAWHRVMAWLRGGRPQRTSMRSLHGFRKYPVAPRLGAYHVRRRLLERLGGGIRAAGTESGTEF